jgi:hypothetical protein
MWFFRMAQFSNRALERDTNNLLTKSQHNAGVRPYGFSPFIGFFPGVIGSEGIGGKPL